MTQKMNILDLIEKDTDLSFTKKATTQGGEYSGACPWCGGTDRFSIHPGQDHFVCRKCKKAGDSISFVIHFHDKSYLEACKILNISPDRKARKILDLDARPNFIWTPRENTLPPDMWQEKATTILFQAYKYLLSPAGKQHREWLNARGISNDTIKSARMGWISSQMSFDPESWGLPSQKGEGDKKRQIWIPVGLMIPFFVNGKPVRLRIRQSDPGATNRFVLVSGSAMQYFNYNQHMQAIPDMEKPVIITESELDGWLLQQELGDLLNVYAIGNSSSRPDEHTYNAIRHAPILLNLDDDEAGHAEQPWWKQHFKHVFTLFSDFGKDPGDSYSVGVDIRKWGEQGLGLIPDTVLKSFKKRTSMSNSAQTKKAANDKIEEKIKAMLEAAKIEHKPQERRPSIIGACIHGLRCQSLRDGECLVSKQKASKLERCPKDKWWIYKHPSGNISQIILGVGLKNEGARLNF